MEEHKTVAERGEDHRRAPLHYSTSVPAPKGLVRAVEEQPAIAMLVIHGMGEQKRFETIDTIVHGLGEHCPGITIDSTSARTVQLDDFDPVQRTEIEYRKQGEESKRFLHVYEAYWAPLTEGEVTSADVLVFLFSAAWNGIRKWPNDFVRWIYRAPAHYPIPGAAVIELAVAALTLAALVAINLVVVAVVVAKKWTQADNGPLLDDLETVVVLLLISLALTAAALLISKFWRKAIASAIGFVSVFGSLAMIIATAWLFGALIIHHTKAVELPHLSWPWLVAGIVLAGVAVLWRGLAPSQYLGPLAVLCIGGALFVVSAAYYTVAAVGRILLPEYGAAAPCDLWHSLFFVGACRNSPATFIANDGWIVIAISAMAVVTAVGMWIDVPAPTVARPSGMTATAMVIALIGTPVFVYSVSTGIYLWASARFGFQMRQEVSAWTAFVLLFAASWLIKNFLIQYVGDVAAYVSSFRLDRFFKLRKDIQDLAAGVARTVYGIRPLYDSVLIVGHSLGSVVSYDTLNRVLLEEELGSPTAPRVAARTKLLLTFGSPLNKIAYLFTALSDTKDLVREQLASSLQPLIDDRASRAVLQWVNVWSPNDVISGHLDFFDPRGAAGGVENIIDEQAMTPGAAHVEYWDDPKIYSVILRHL